MRRTIIVSLSTGALVAGQLLMGGSAQANSPATVVDQVNALQAAENVNSLAAAPNTVYSVTATTNDKEVTAGGNATISANVLVPMSQSGAGATVAIQQLTNIDSGTVGWKTLAQPVTIQGSKSATSNYGTASASVPVGTVNPAKFRTVAMFNPPTTWPTDGSIPTGAVVSSLLTITVKAPTPATPTSVSAVWPTSNPMGSGEQFTVAVDSNGGEGLPVYLEYSADGSTWNDVGLPLANSVSAIEDRPTTDANGDAKATLIAPMAPGTYTFRARIDNATSEASGSFTVGDIDFETLYNPPGYSSSNSGGNYMPSEPGQLIKAQKLDTGAADVNNQPPQYPANPSNNPISGAPGFVAPKVMGAGSPACMFRTNTLDDCFVGSTVTGGVDTYRIMYSTQRFTVNPPPLNDDGTYGTYDVNNPESLGSTKIPGGTTQAPMEAASGLVFKPKNAGPDSKVVVWTHPTIGQTNHCSISRGFTSFEAPLSVEPMPPSTSLNEGDMSFFLEQMLEAGHTVVLPDYLGIAVNGPTNTKKSYLVGQQEARDVFYAVKSMQTNPSTVPGWEGFGGQAMTNADFVTIGHSQGGHSAIWTGIGSAQDWAKGLNLNLKGVVGVAPATDISMITRINWEGLGGWVLGPQLIQTYLNMSEDFTKFALANNVSSPEGFAALPTFQDYCALQSSPASAPYVNSGTNFFLSPEEYPGAFDNWDKVFAQQTPIIDPGKMNSFPQDMPLLMISGTADNVVIAQLQAAFQQSFCEIDDDGKPKAENFRAYWTPTMGGLNTPAAMTFNGQVNGTTLQVSEVKGGSGKPLTKPLIAKKSDTVFQVGNLTGIRVGDALIKINDNKAPAAVVITNIDYATNTITFNTSPGIASVSSGDMITVQPGNVGILGPGVTFAYTHGTSNTVTEATIEKNLTGIGGVGTYQLTAATGDNLADVLMAVPMETTPLGQPSNVSLLQSPTHANPILFPFTTAEEVTQSKAAVTSISVPKTEPPLSVKPKPATIFVDQIPSEFTVGSTVYVSNVDRSKIDGEFKIKSIDQQNKSFIIDVSSSTKEGNVETPNGIAQMAPIVSGYANSASEAITFMTDTLAGNPIDANCMDVNEKRPTGLDIAVQGESWYSTPVMFNDGLNLPKPETEEFYKSWGSPALKMPDNVNTSPSIGLLIGPYLGSTALTIYQDECAAIWKPLIDNFQTNKVRLANDACKPFGLYPYGFTKEDGSWDPNYVYTTVDVENGKWGTYPNNGATDSQWVNAPTQERIAPAPDPQPTPDPTPEPQPAPAAASSTFVGVAPTRVYDSRISGEGKVAGSSGRVVSVADGRSLNDHTVTQADVVPEGATAVAYNVTVVNQEGTGWVSVQPGDAQAVTTSALNWTESNTAIANGLASKLDANRALKIHNGSVAPTDVVVDVVGYYLPAEANTGSLFHPVTPGRMYDSRTANNGEPVLLQPGMDNALTLKVANLPEGSNAIAYNVTVVEGQSNGWLSVMPGDATAVTSSTLNWKAGTKSLANGQIVGLDNDDQIKIVNGSDAPVHVVVDFAGYFVDQAQDDGTGKHFYPVDPQRAHDSRLVDNGVLPGGSEQSVSLADGKNVVTGAVASTGLVPADSAAALVNIAAIRSESSGWLSVRPGSATGSSETSSVNWSNPGAVVANGVTSEVAGQQVKVTSGATGNTNYIVDVFGYYQ